MKCELLSIRFKVMQDYPSSPFKIGDVIKLNGGVFGTGEPQKFVRNPEKYPQIFHKLKN